MKKTVLIVDDEKVWVRVTKELIISKSGGKYRIKTAFNGKEALDIIEDDEIDIMILDMNMPVMDGHQLLQELKKRGVKIPTIVLTGNWGMESELYIGAFGIKKFVEKPVDINSLLKTIEEVIGKSEEE